MEQVKKLTLIDKAKETLSALSIDVTLTDKKEAAKELGLNRVTITRYLNGEVRDLDTAATIIQSLKKRIVQKEKRLAA